MNAVIVEEQEGLMCGEDDCRTVLPAGSVAYEVFEGVSYEGLEIALVVCEPHAQARG